MWKKMMITRRFFSTGLSARGWWNHVRPAPMDPIVGVTEAFLADRNPQKINLGEGAYRDDEGRPVVLECVREAERKISGYEFLESNSSSASSKFVEESVKLVYGEDSTVIKEGRVSALQAISGTGACRLFAEFQRRFYPQSPIFLPDPTWSNHHNIWREAGVPVRTFRYYDSVKKELNFTGLIEDLKNAPEGSFFLLHPCAHNPTGVDPTEEQWREISSKFKEKNHFPFFDMAYQAFASGDLDEDSQAIHIFIEDGHLIGCAQSFSKNMALYGQRVGCLSMLSNDVKQAFALRTQLQRITRAMYSSPPVHGLLLVSTILSDPNLRSLWIREVKGMVNRIQRMRSSLLENLENLSSTLNWEHIIEQVGMFYFSGLTSDQVNQLAREFHIYMTCDGRISMAGVTPSNVSYLASAINQVSKAGN